MANSQSLTKTSKDNLLMSHITWQTNAVDMHTIHISTSGSLHLFAFLWIALLMSSTHLRNHSRSLESCTRWGIQLLVMMKLYNLHLWHIFGSLLGHQHHQYSANSKIWCNKAWCIVVLCQLSQLCLGLPRKTCGANNRRYSLLQCLDSIAIYHIWAGKVYHNLWLGILNGLVQIVGDNYTRFAHAHHFTGINAGFNINSSY